MKYLSVCSGIEAATSAWHHMGWEPVAFSEIEPFPSAVLKHHYPDVPNVGDMTKFKEWNIGTIDLLVGGTPCQSFSVAGLRKGLDDPRGNLMLTFGAIARHLSPRWLVWENVPGVLSSNGGRDFGTFLGMLGELGYGFAYRVLDAQYFGVAQRRRRVFVVGCLGDWRSAAAVLFELASLSGNPPPSREARKITPTLSASGTGVSRVGFNCEDEWFVPERPQWWDGGDSAASLTTRCHDQSMPDKGNFAAVVQPIPVTVNQDSSVFEYHPADSRVKEMGEVCQTMTSRWGTGGGNIPIAMQPIPLDLRNANRDPEKHDEVNRQGVGVGDEGDPAHTLTSACVHGVVQPIVLMDQGGSSMDVRSDGLVGTLRRETHGHEPLVMQPIPFRKSKRAQSVDDDESWVEGEVANTINLFDQGDTRTTHAVVQAIPIHDKATRHSGGGNTRNDDGAGNGFGVGKDGDPAPTITAGDKHAIAFSSNMSVPDCSEDLSPTLKLGGQGGANPPAVAVGTDCYNGTITGDVAATMGTPGSSVNASGPTVMQAMAVRRLTPVECERLQGFSDNHTLIPWRGKEASQCPDGPRYKALGNSMAVPVMRWIGERIRMINELSK